jgi:hypothetical protein
MRVFVFSLFIFFSGSLVGQVTDTDIVNSILGKKFFEVNTKLDSLGVWYHIHLQEKFKENVRVYSISDGDGTVKVFTLSVENGTINEVKINYRHDSKEQIEDAMKITTQTSFNVGHYSTDMVFKYKK